MNTRAAVSALLLPLKSAHIPFARFSVSPYWPSEWVKYWQGSGQSTFLAKLDNVIHGAEDAGFLLIPSFLWNLSGISDVFGEHVNAWDNPSSQTRAFAANFIGTIVNRYKSSSAIWMWEAGNEFNAYVDLPNGTTFWPPVNVSLGTPAQRTAPQDLLTTKIVNDIVSAVTTTIRQYDTTRPISTGFACPLYDAYHLAQGLPTSNPNEWAADSQAQYVQAILNLTPAKSVESMHLYPQTLPPLKFGNPVTYAQELQTLVSAAQTLGTPSFLGEFGVPISANPSSDQAEFANMMAAIQASQINYSALWVYDFASQNSTFNVTFQNNRSYMLSALTAANKTYGI